MPQAGGSPRGSRGSGQEATALSPLPFPTMHRRVTVALPCPVGGEAHPCGQAARCGPWSLSGQAEPLPGGRESGCQPPLHLACGVLVPEPG